MTQPDGAAPADRDLAPRSPAVSETDARLAGRVLFALRKVAPAGVLPALSALLREELHAADLRLYLTDYRMLALHLVAPQDGQQAQGGPDDESEPMSDSLPGRVFLTQRPLTEPAAGGGSRALVPVTVRGQRLGVLSAVLPFPAPATASTSAPASAPVPLAADGVSPALLAVAADVLAHVLVDAGRGSDVFEVHRRSARFTVAAEMQWRLLPGRALSVPAFTVAGQLEPAPHVQGDAFDWSADADALTLCAVHVTGRGQSAALLSTLAVTALRNARRAELSLADQACLADQAVFAEHGGDQHVSALLMRISLDGDAQVVDAGSPALLRLRGQHAERVHLDAQLPLGMFDDTPYVAQDLRLQAGDRLLIATPGAVDVSSPDGRRFGEDGLRHQLERTRTVPPQEVARRVIAALMTHHGEDLGSDATLLCLDWRGR